MDTGSITLYQLTDGTSVCRLRFFNLYRCDGSGQVRAPHRSIPDHHYLVQILTVLFECYIYDGTPFYGHLCSNKTQTAYFKYSFFLESPVYRYDVVSLFVSACGNVCGALQKDYRTDHGLVVVIRDLALYLKLFAGGQLECCHQQYDECK